MNSASDSLSHISTKRVLFLMGFLVCAMGYVCLKDNPLPKMVLFGGALLGSWVVLRSGFFRLEGFAYLLVAYYPFSSQIPVDFGNMVPGLNLTNILLVTTTILWLRERDKTQPLFERNSLSKPIFIFFLIGIFSIFRGLGYGTGYLGEAIIQYYRKWVVCFWIYFLFFNAIRTREAVKNIVLLIGMVTTLVALMSIYEYMDTDERVRGIFEQENFLAAFFNYYMFILFGFFALNWRKLRFWTLLIPFLLCLRGVMVTFSRAGYLAFAISCFAVTYFRSKLLFLGLILLAIFVYHNPVFLPEGVRYRLGQTIQKKVDLTQTGEITTEQLEVSAGDRVKVWNAAKYMIKDHPLLGVGFERFESKVLHYWTGRKTHDPHNTYLLIAAEMGIPALMVFLLILWRIFRSARSLYVKTQEPFSKALALGFLAGFFGLLVSNIYGSRLNYAEVTSYFWILTALIMRLAVMESRSPLPSIRV